jgi:FAD dependent oxidoreductase
MARTALPPDIGPNRKGRRVDLEADALSIGAGCGGVAAALAAAVLSRNVGLAAPSRWLSGQPHAQAVPPDEQPWVETTGITALYRQMQKAARDHHRAQRRMAEQACSMPRLNPGGAE